MPLRERSIAPQLLLLRSYLDAKMALQQMAVPDVPMTRAHSSPDDIVPGGVTGAPLSHVAPPTLSNSHRAPRRNRADALATKPPPVRPRRSSSSTAPL